MNMVNLQAKFNKIKNTIFKQGKFIISKWFIISVWWYLKSSFFTEIN